MILSIFLLNRVNVREFQDNASVAIATILEGELDQKVRVLICWEFYFSQTYFVCLFLTLDMAKNGLKIVEVKFKYEGYNQTVFF